MLPDASICINIGRHAKLVVGLLGAIGDAEWKTCKVSYGFIRSDRGCWIEDRGKFVL